MPPTKKTALAAALRGTGKSTIKLLAAEVNCRPLKNGVPSKNASAADLAAHLCAYPVQARRAAAILAASSRPEQHAAVLHLVQNIPGVSRSTHRTWTVDALPGGGCRAAQGKAPATWLEYSTDPRVGIVALSAPDAEQAQQWAGVKMPREVRELVNLTLGPPPQRVKSRSRN